MQAHHTDMALLGDRRITLVVGIFTTTGEFVPINVCKEELGEFPRHSGNLLEITVKCTDIS